MEHLIKIKMILSSFINYNVSHIPEGGEYEAQNF
jgi:hypothetical protein